MSVLMQTQHRSSGRSSDVTDSVLIQQARIGDQGAFEILVDRYSALLFCLIFSMLQDEHLAHDVLQHAFLQLYRSLPTLQTDRTIKAWLCQVARYRCIDELRVRRRRPLFFSEMGENPDGEEFSFLVEIPDPDRQPEEQVELIELRQRILEAIKRLPARMSAVVLLRYARQLSFCEIGQALSMPESTAKTYFSRARKPLRILLELECADNRGIGEIEQCTQ
jgi:RNA polymerase sigma factor (sigma-70 family)